MNLEEILGNLDSTNDTLTICAAKSPDWTPLSEAELCRADRVPNGCRLPYFLEVSVAKNVLRAWSFARAGGMPTLAEKCAAVIYYAENDAYLLLDQDDPGE
jgi:hypothetical protein